MNESTKKLTGTTLCDRIRMVRKAKQLKQNGFAKKIGYSRSYISKIEKGKVSKPDERMLIIISQTFGCSLMWLKTGAGNMYGHAHHSVHETSAMYVSPHKDLLRQAQDVLASNTHLADSLAANIRSFHRAMKEADDLKKEVGDLKSRMDELERDRSPDPGAFNGSGVGGGM